MVALVRQVFRRFVWPALLSVGVVSVTAAQASASLNWTWNYSAAGVVASGTFSTSDIPDALGFYLITGISGTRNGEMISGLQPTGTAIPGNEPFAVDNLVRLDGPQLTHNGFGYAIAGGIYANPFFADFASPARYMEFFSAPPFTGPSNTELPITFAATLTNLVPEPETYALLLIGLGVLSGVGYRGVSTSHRVPVPPSRNYRVVTLDLADHGDSGLATFMRTLGQRPLHRSC